MKRKGAARIVSLFLTLSVMLTVFAGMSVSAAAQSKWDGWLRISSAADLLRMNNSQNKFYLTKDIDLKGKQWTEDIVFKGTLDGNGYRIKNLTGSRSGLFTTLGNATIQNLGLCNVSIKKTGSAGAFSAKAYGTSFINCYVTGTIESTCDTAGFIGTGSATNPNKYTDCVNLADIIGKGNAAGFEADSGYSELSGKFLNCINYGRISGKGTDVAGICGYLNGEMKSCFNFGKIINSNTKYVGGGLAGFANDKALFTDCATTTDAYMSRTSPVCIAQADARVDLAKLKKSSAYKGYDFSGTWFISSAVNSGRPVLTTMLKNYSATKPTASVKSGKAVKKGTKIELSTNIKGGVIRYTTNGLTPSIGSAKYTGAIEITKNTTIRAAVFVNGRRAYVAVLTYTVKK